MDKLRYSAVGFALPILLYGLFTTTTDLQNPLFAKGQIQEGHSDISCGTCHTKSPGTSRQQIQAVVHYQLGLRETSVDFGYQEVTSQSCLSCHERQNERHPIYRFQEPRFEKALDRVEATSCLGCHSEHVNRKAHNDVEFCVACHTDLVLKSDPLDVSHEVLTAEKRWDSCLECHDFHGNHIHNTPQKLDDRYLAAEVRNYLASGPSPYGDKLHYEAKKE